MEWNALFHVDKIVEKKIKLMNDRMYHIDRMSNFLLKALPFTFLIGQKD